MLTRARVQGLLGQFDHDVSLRQEWEFAILYGLNGVGKTRFLELINAAITLKIDRLFDAEFRELLLESSDGKVLAIKASDEFKEDEAPGPRLLAFTLTQGKRSISSWETPMHATREDDEFRNWLSRSTWEPISNDLWEDSTDGEVVEFSALKRRYARPPRPRSPLEAMDIPVDIRQFAEENQTYLIETQRLISQAPPRSRGAAAGTRQAMKSSVDAYSSDLKQRIGAALARNSLSSQRLDRSFPRRIITPSRAEAWTEDEIRRQYFEQNEHRRRLADIGLTSPETELPLPSRTLEDWQRTVLTVYLKDNHEKLATFDDLLARITLLEELINGRFLRKRIDVNADEGLVVHEARTGKVIPATGLSTGEQHELVLFYNLLFRSDPGTLVLIDEPEISLHVTWQKNFITDILRISQLSSFKFLIATHSPQIIGNWWSRTIELGPHEETED